LRIRHRRALREELLAVYGRRGWRWREAGDPPVLVSELHGARGSWLMYVQVVEEAALLVVYSVLPVDVPPARRQAVAEFVTRANYGLSLGNLEMDFGDGEVRAKVALAVGEHPPDDVLVERLIRVSGKLVEMFLPGIEAVVQGTDPLAAADALGADGDRTVVA
jgi:hypothetical protein